jgi:hypothetical protein
VVDFSHGGGSSQIQSELPRPFYCTRYDENGSATGGFFNDHDWWFYTLPSNVTIKPEQIYIGWQWHTDK